MRKPYKEREMIFVKGWNGVKRLERLAANGRKVDPDYFCGVPKAQWEKLAEGGPYEITEVEPFTNNSSSATVQNFIIPQYAITRIWKGKRSETAKKLKETGTSEE